MSTDQEKADAMLAAMRSANETNRKLHAQLGEYRECWPEIRYALNLVIRRHDVDEDMKERCRQVYAKLEIKK